MRTMRLIVSTVIASVAFLSGLPLVSQELAAPNTAAREGGVRAARFAAAAIEVDGQAQHKKVVLTDSTLGAIKGIWFEPSARATTFRSPEAAVVQFLASYQSPAYGMDSTVGALHLDRSRNDDGNVFYFFYSQRHGGIHVLGGRLVVTVARMSRGYMVQSATGSLFPDISIVATPGMSFDAATAAATALHTSATFHLTGDTTPVIVAHDGSYRLSYRIQVNDPTRRATIERFVDAHSGEVFAEERDHSYFADNHLPANVRAPANKPRARTPTSHVLGSYVEVDAIDWGDNEQSFFVWDTGSIQEVRDNGHAGVDYIEIRNQTVGDDHFNISCGGKPTVTHAQNLQWGDSNFEKEVTSTVHNLGVSLDYFRNTWGFDGMRDDGDPLVACVHAGGARFNGRYNADANALTFTKDTAGDAPTGAAQEIVTHEFAHGVTNYLVSNWVNNATQNKVNEALSQFFQVRQSGTRCNGSSDYQTSFSPCFYVIDLESMDEHYCDEVPAGEHCQGIRLSSALLDAVDTLSGAHASRNEQNVMYGFPSMIKTDGMFGAAHAIVARARNQAHYGSSDWANAAKVLESQLALHSLHNGEYNVQMAGGYGSWTLAIGGYFCHGDVDFEWGTYGIGSDNSVQWPDGEIDLGSPCDWGDPVTVYDYELDYHNCSDGHYHGFRVTITSAYGPLMYYDAQSGCSSPLMAGPSVMPRRFAVRQAVIAPSGSELALSSGGTALSLSALVREHGLTSLDVDIPAGTAPAPIEVAVYNPQGRLIRRFQSAAAAPGTQRLAWDRKDSGGRDVPAGVYIVVVKHGSFQHRTNFVIPARP